MYGEMAPPGVEGHKPLKHVNCQPSKHKNHNVFFCLTQSLTESTSLSVGVRSKEQNTLHFDSWPACPWEAEMSSRLWCDFFLTLTIPIDTYHYSHNFVDSN